MLEKESESGRENKGALAIRICIGLGDNTAMRYEILATGDRFCKEGGSVRFRFQ